MPADIEVLKVQRALAAMMQKIDEIETMVRDTLEKVIELEVQLEEDEASDTMSEYTLESEEEEEEEREGPIRDVEVVLAFTNG